MGATRAVNVANEDLRDVMSDLNMTEGFDVGLEMSGVVSAFQSMLDTMNHGARSRSSASCLTARASTGTR